MMGGCEDNKEAAKQQILIEDDLKQTSSPRKQKMSKHKSPKRCKDGNNESEGTPRRKGKRRLRRFENLKYLLSLVEKEELDELNLDHFVEPTMSAFAELLTEHEKMKVWNDFVNHTEEEQTFFLQNKQYSDDVKDGEGDGSATTSKNQAQTEWVEVEADITDKREAHPAFSADESFKRIDSNLKALLHKRHLPKGVLAQLEEQIISFFNEWPNSVYVSKLPSSFERLLLHAVCQYLDLKSHSFCCQGERQTEVENKRQTFSPPDTTLTTYLEEKLVLH